MTMVNVKLVKIALEYVEGNAFENFFNAFYPVLAGIEFVPLGGYHDGGADAFLDNAVYEAEGQNSGGFYQASTEADYRSKIRRTVQRLREFGRDPKSLTYVTSRRVGAIDQEEEVLHTELHVFVKIRDCNWIAGNVNSSPATVAAFQSYLQPAVAFLGEIGGATLISASDNIPARTMCVFLGQELERRRGKADILEAVTDSLILWALEGTNPDNGIFLKRAEILNKVELTLPAAKQFIRGVFDHRIEVMSAKNNPTGREIRWYKKEDKFCLPLKTREFVKEENTEDEYLKVSVMAQFTQRATRLLATEDIELEPAKASELAHRSIELTFEKEGLELAAFLTGESDDRSYNSISDQVDEAIAEQGFTGKRAVVAKEVALSILREAFYTSSPVEREYFGKLSRTYILLFTIRNEPRVVEYFKSMSTDFILYIGSDIIIRALSERFLRKEDQMTVNMLDILRDAGSTLILTESALEEVHAHLRGTDREFRGYFMMVESTVDLMFARHASKILIRAYFYAKLQPLSDDRPLSWASFMGQICNYENLHDARGKRQVQSYLQVKFGMEFISHDDLAELVDGTEVEELAEKIKPDKTDDVLALNDATQILAVYGKRKNIGEQHCPNQFGFRTWWLTHETRVRQHTTQLVNDKSSQYIMRPEFILNFIALSPDTEEVRRSYGTIFPTLLGVRLSNRMREDIFHDVMDKVKEAWEVDEARAQAKVEDMSNRLKGDHFKRYESDLISERLLGE